MKKENIYTEDCPATPIRKYIESLITKQKEYLERGEEIPQEFLIPQDIVLSPKNIEFLMDSKLVDFFGAGETGNEMQFYWRESEKYPPLEIRVKRDPKGRILLTYINEHAKDTTGQFIWDKNEKDGKKGIITFSKTTDALEGICNMNYKKR